MDDTANPQTERSDSVADETTSAEAKPQPETSVLAALSAGIRRGAEDAKTAGGESRSQSEIRNRSHGILGGLWGFLRGSFSVDFGKRPRTRILEIRLSRRRQGREGGCRKVDRETEAA